MKLKKVVILCISLMVASYFAGCFIPLEYFILECDDTKISKAEIVKIFISVVAAFLTFSAVIVALFKEKILNKFNKPILKVEIPSEKPIIEEITKKMSIDQGEIIEAEKYISRLCVKNTGNLTATGVEIFLEKISFRALNTTIDETFEQTGDSLKWNNSKETINIPPGTEKLINVVDIIAPKKSSTPDSSNIKEEAKISVGNFLDSSRKHSPGIWTAIFTIYAQNHKHMHVKVKIEWKGKWKSRLTEFQGEYKYEIQNL